jgi:predicted DCC family thiol-disulfide oxidoreductase YuxK
LKKRKGVDQMEKRDIILFDGVCHLCQSSVQFIIKRDPQNHFAFASLQSEIAKNLIEQKEITEESNSVVLIKTNGKSYKNSSAALRIAKELKGVWKLAAILLIIPVFIRDPIYRFIARHRYTWFGKSEKCMMPTPSQRRRFLD